MNVKKENEIDKIEGVIKVLRRTKKNSYNISVVYIDAKKYDINIKGEFMQVSKKMTLEDLALIVNQGFKTVNERLDDIERDVTELKVDVAELKVDVAELKVDVSAIKNCPTIKAELNR